MISNINHLTSAVPPISTKKEGKISAKSASFQESMQNTLATRDRLDTHQAAGKLSTEELSQLSRKYPAGHMTQEEYDAFLDELEEKGSVMAVSDVGVGAQLARTAVTGAVMNVYINTKSMKNRDRAEEINSRAGRALARGTETADKIYARVCTRLKGNEKT